MSVDLGMRRNDAEVIGVSTALRRVLEQVERLRASTISVCVQGESGVGKELIARAIHARSPKADGPFIAVNCAAVPENLAESELFGHERGAFTGAHDTYRGCFEQAAGGTLFLDEVSEMPLSTQAKLLRVLQEPVYRRVGGTSDLPMQARIVSATNRDLEAEVDAGRFRADLYFRLVAYPIDIPALRERREDVPLLVEHILGRAAAELGGRPLHICEDALERIVAWDWPGNVRQLENVIRRALLSATDGEIRLADLPEELRSSVSVVPRSHVERTRAAEELPDVSLRELETRAIEQALRRAGGNIDRAAKRLGIGRATVYRRLSRGSGTPRGKR